ncbi:phosphotransferase enzyme family protein [Ornithinibacillus scapharcae]|uniref:phosphotransferase enzyme family protein n=1 Tax=Ornithinibacillus scapharcae TaxID=1147159 RepID=UPI000225AA53|nr:phosphotransferase [Ornithinibacillus scapharcae]
MEYAVERVFRPGIIDDFLKEYNLDKTYKLLGDFENYVYEVYRGKETYILRITHSSHRSEEELYGELDWINFLHQHGANVSVVFPSINQNLIEKQVAEDGTIFFACLFSKVSGVPIRSNDERFSEPFFESWGKEIGKMHRITKEYQPDAVFRKQWFEDDLFELEKYVPQEELVIQQTKKVVAVLKELPREEGFGLIHNDVHNGNFFYDGKGIHVFDFDDACYFWHVSDIAIPLYYSCYSLFPNKNMPGKEEFANRFITAFMFGYQQEMEPPKEWETLLPLFLKVRDITLYAALHKKIATEDRNELLQKRMQDIKDRIENGEPIVLVNGRIGD